MPGFNFHSVHMNMGTLLIECTSCNRRVALTKEDGLPIYQGNMDTLNSAKFRCRKCGSTEVRAYMPRTRDQIDYFLAGDPVGTMEQVSSDSRED